MILSDKDWFSCFLFIYLQNDDKIETLLSYRKIYDNYSIFSSNYYNEQAIKEYLTVNNETLWNKEKSYYTSRMKL